MKLYRCQECGNVKACIRQILAKPFILVGVVSLATATVLLGLDRETAKYAEKFLEEKYGEAYTEVK